MGPKSIAQFSPTRLLLASILFSIICATLLLSLPWCRTQPLSLIDLSFTATSALCICGLTTIPLDSFTFVGKAVLLLLIQIGGLGLITLTLFLMSFFIQFGFTTQLMAGQLLELESWKNIKNLLYFIIGVTVIVEGIGTLAFFAFFYPLYGTYKGLFFALFHTVSSFCHAGFSLFPNSMALFDTHYPILLLTSFIIVLSGIGFVTWYDILQYARKIWHHKRIPLTLQSKIVLSMMGILIPTATVLYWIIEHNNTLDHFSGVGAWINALFNGICIRGTGFATVPTDHLQLATLLIIMLMAFIGSAPGSTGSGIKITTFALAIGVVKAACSGKTDINLMGRTVAQDQVFKAITIIFLLFAWIFIATFCLLLTEDGWSFIDIFFEVVSACATLGLSTGITPFLTFTGKLFIIMSMIIGRIGALGLVLAFRMRHEIAEFSYPKERIMVG